MDGTFKNGDKWTGYRYQEAGTWYFRAVDQAGNEYDTDEVPSTEPILTVTQWVGSNWTSADFE